MVKIDKKTLFGVLVSLFFLVLLLKKIDFGQLIAALRQFDVRYLVPAVLSTFASYFLRAVRWQYLLMHEKKVSLGSAYSATIIGYMANNIFPARLGEFIRAWVLAEKESLKAPKIFASLVIDRLFDGATVLLMLVLALATITLPTGMERNADLLKMGGYATLVFYLLVLVGLFLLKTRTMWMLRIIGKLLRPFPQKISDKIIPLLGNFIEGIKISGKLSHLFVVLVSSMLIWLFAVWPVDLVLKGFGITLPFSSSLFIMVLLVFAVMIPSAPGFIGTYHMACYTGLSAFKVADDKAVSIAIVIHGLAFFPVILAGFYHLWAGGLTLKRIESSADSGAIP